MRKGKVVKDPVEIVKRKFNNEYSVLYYIIKASDGNIYYKLDDIPLLPETSIENRKQNIKIYKNAESKRQNLIEQFKADEKVFISTLPDDLLHPFVDKLVREKNIKTFTSSSYKIKNFFPITTRFSDITPKDIENYRDYLSLEPMTLNSRRIYFGYLKHIMKAAVDEKKIKKSPIQDKSAAFFVMKDSIEYVTEEEVYVLLNTEIDPQSEVVKKAFLFGCFTGMRFTDILFLDWKNISMTDNGTKIEMLNADN